MYFEVILGKFLVWALPKEASNNAPVNKILATRSAAWYVILNRRFRRMVAWRPSFAWGRRNILWFIHTPSSCHKNNWIWW